jgi:NAD-dependent SIR2 family protein deacetylase
MKAEHAAIESAAGQLWQWLRGCDRVLIGAGAGLSAAAGIDYTDVDSFARLFPALVRRGFRARYELIGFDDWTPAEKWGYWATHVNDVRFGDRRHAVYATLLDLIRDKDYFVLTSNVDAMFARNGFDEQRIYTPQGDYAGMQCLTPCRREVWQSRPVIDRLLPAIDAATQAVRDPDVLPRCPWCHGEVFLHVHAGPWFIHEPFAGQAKRFRRWLDGARGQATLVIEVGAGFNTPAVVRWPMEWIARAIPNAQFVRINSDQADVPTELAGRSMTLQADARDVLTALWSRCAPTGQIER